METEPPDIAQQTDHDLFTACPSGVSRTALQDSDFTYMQSVLHNSTLGVGLCLTCGTGATSGHTKEVPLKPPAASGPPWLFDLTSMSVLAGMFLTICVFMVLGLYCESRRRKKYYLFEWNNNTPTFPVPWYLFQLKNLEDSLGEEQSLLSSCKDTRINMYTSKNKADSKYPKLKKKFPYFVTIPEEEEVDQETRRVPTKIFPKSFPHF